MAKFCNYCGTQLEDSATFCANCGAQLEAAKTSTASTPQSKSTSSVQLEVPVSGDSFFAKNKNKLIGGGIAIVAVIIIISVASSIVSGFGYKGPIKNYFKAIEKEKGKYMVKAMPDFLIDIEEPDDDDIEKLDKIMEDLKEAMTDSVGKNPSITYEILDKIEINEETLEDMTDSINEKYKKKLDDDIEVTAGYEVLLKLTAKGSRDKMETYTSMEVYKIDGDWCINEFDF